MSFVRAWQVAQCHFVTTGMRNLGDALNKSSSRATPRPGALYSYTGRPKLTGTTPRRVERVVRKAYRAKGGRGRVEGDGSSAYAQPRWRSRRCPGDGLAPRSVLDSLPCRRCSLLFRSSWRENAVPSTCGAPLSSVFLLSISQRLACFLLPPCAPSSRRSSPCLAAQPASLATEAQRARGFRNFLLVGSARSPP